MHVYGVFGLYVCMYVDACIVRACIWMDVRT
jgi:hypothetical protein